MCRRLPARALVTCIAVWSFSVPAAAQQSAKAEISGGYQLLHFGSGVNETFEKGWFAEMTGNIKPWLGAVVQVGGSYKTIRESMTEEDLTGTATADLRAHHFMGGVRFSAQVNDRVRPFAQVLAGGFHGSTNVSVSVTQAGETLFASSSGGSSTDFALQVGGGMNLMMTKTAGIKAEGGLIRVFESGEQFNVFRFAAGAVFAF
jgi:Outer membrane protein beta-barrel domain